MSMACMGCDMEVPLLQRRDCRIGIVDALPKSFKRA